jgi:glyoxylase-like metal-dependent hydrolase (beta-lactamase superfamily II)
MTPAAVSFRIGSARVTSFNVGDLSLRLDEVFAPGSADARYFGGRDMTAPQDFPTKSFLVASGPLTVVVDPSDYGRLLSPDHFKARAVHVSPPTLEAQLAAAGVAPESVTHVVVTHLHFDHYAGVTKGGSLAFPSARYIIPAKDWETPEMAEARDRGDADVAQTLRVVEAAGRLEPLDGQLDLGSGLTVEPFPGETPGHLVVGIRSGPESCYLVGDLYHLAEEVEHPELAAVWADAGALAASRRRFSERAAAERALVIPGHLPAGRISFKGSSPTWTEESA